MKKVLVTGADGLVGRAVCRRLLELGCIPRAGVWKAEAWPALKESTPGLREFALLGDLGRSPEIRSALDGVSVVIHLAARVHVMQDDALDPLAEFRRVNVGGTAALARAAAAMGAHRFVYVSTVKVNGEFTLGRPFSEEDPPAPQEPYAVSKWEAEETLRGIAAKTGLEFSIIRPPLVYGPGVRANFLRLMRLVERGFPLPFPNTNNRRSLIGVENLADCLARCATHPAAANRTFLISDGDDLSTRDLVIRLAALFGRPARFLPVPEFALRLAAQLAGKRPAADRLLGSLQVDSGHLRRRLEWEPPVKLNSGLEATVRCYLESGRQLA